MSIIQCLLLSAYFVLPYGLFKYFKYLKHRPTGFVDIHQNEIHGGDRVTLDYRHKGIVTKIGGIYVVVFILREPKDLQAASSLFKEDIKCSGTCFVLGLETAITKFRVEINKGE